MISSTNLRSVNRKDGAKDSAKAKVEHGRMLFFDPVLYVRSFACSGREQSINMPL